MADFNLTVGLDVDLSYEQMKRDIKALLSEINGDPHTIKIQVDKKQANKDIASLKTQIKNLCSQQDFAGINNGLKNEFNKTIASVDRCAQRIDKLRKKLADIDNDSSFQNTNASFENFGSIIENIRLAIEELSKSIASFKCINFEFKTPNPIDKNIEYGKSARQTINELRNYATQLSSELSRFYGTSDTFEGHINALMKATNGTDILQSGGNFDLISYIDRLSNAMNNVGSLSGQMDTLREYINLVQQAASAKGIDVSSVTSSFSKSADKMVEDTMKIKSTSGQIDAMKKSIPSAFGQSFDMEQVNSLFQTLQLSVDNILDILKSLNASSTDGFVSSINKATEAMNRLVEAAGKLKNVNLMSDAAKGANSANEQISDMEQRMSMVNAALKEIDLTNRSISSAYGGMKKALGGEAATGQNASELDAMKAKYIELQAEIERLKTSNALATQDEINNIYRLQAELQSLINTTQERFEAEKQASQEAATARKAEEDAAKEAKKAKAEAARQAKEDAKLANEKISLTKQYYDTIRRLENALKDYSAAESSRNSESAGAYSSIRNSKTDLKAAFDVFQPKNKDFDDFKKKLSDANIALKENAEKIKENGDATKTFSERMGKIASNASSWITISKVIMFAIRSIRQMINVSIELDSSMNQMQIVTKASANQMNAFADTASDAAKRVGSSINSFVDSATVYARLGYNMDESSQLAEYTAMLQKIGDIDTNDAQDAITSIVKAFSDEIDINNIESVMDKLVTVGNGFPISVSQIAEAMNNASSTLSAAGNSFEESVALLTAANVTIQDAAKSSTGLRTIAARIRNTKTELDNLGETMSESSYEELVQMLTNCSVALTDVNGEYRSTYDIMSDIAKQWERMTSTEQAALATAMSGTRQQAVFYSIIEQFKDASGAMEAMANSSGALDESYATYMDSVAFHIDQFKATFQELSSDILESDFLSSLIDSASKALKLVDDFSKLINTLGGLRTVLIAVSGTLLTIKFNSVETTLKKFKDGIVNTGSSIAAFIDKLKALKDAIHTAKSEGKGLSDAFKSAGFSAKDLQIAIGAITAALTIAMAAYSHYRQRLEETRQAQLDTAKESAEEVDNILDLYAAYQQAKDEYETNAESKDSLEEATRNLLSVLGYEETAIDSLIGKYSDLDDEINSVTLSTLDEAVKDAQSGLNAAYDSVQDAFGNGGDIMANIGKYVGFGISSNFLHWDKDTEELDAKVSELLRKSGLVEEYDSGPLYDKEALKDFAAHNIEIDTDSVDEIIASYEKLVQARDILQGGLTPEEYNSSNAVDLMEEKISDFETVLHEYLNEKKIFNDALAQKNLFDELSKKGVPKTADEFKQFKEDFINASVEGGEFFGSEEDISNSFEKALNVLRKCIPELDNVMNQSTEAADTVSSKYKAVSTGITKNAEEAAKSTSSAVEGIGKIQKALNAQSTGTSFSVESFNSEGLAEYSSALETVNGAMRLNAEKVMEIVKAKAEERIADNNSQKAIEQSKYLQNAREIEKLRKQIEEKNYAEGQSEESIQNNIDALLNENRIIKQSCDAYDLMNSSLVEATDAYHNWLNAKDATQSGEMFDGSVEALNKIRDTLTNETSDSYGRVGNEDYKAAIDFVIPESVDRENKDAINSYLDSVKKLFTFDNDGNYAGLNIKEFCDKAVSEGLMVFDESSGDYKIAGKKAMQEFADGMNLSLPLVRAMFGEMEEFGGEFEWSDDTNKTVGDLAIIATESAEALKKLYPLQDLQINIDTGKITDEKVALHSLDETIKEMNGIKAKVDVDATEVEYANNIIRYCVTQKQLLNDPIIMSVDTSMLGETTGNAISLLQNLQSASNELEIVRALGLDTTDAQKKVDSLVQEVQSIDNQKIMAHFDVDTSDYGSIMESIKSSLTGESLVKRGVDAKAIIGFEQSEHDSDGLVTWQNDTKAIDAYAKITKTAVGKVQWQSDTSLLEKTFTGGFTINWVGTNSQSVIGKKSSQVSGHAKVSGNWNSSVKGSTLVGELGQEIVVDRHTGEWYTVGDNGAEFVNIPKDAIVFNHEQSRQLLENGNISSRGNALATGTNEGSDRVSGGISQWLAGIGSLGQAAKNAKSSSKSKGDRNNSGSDKKEETALDRFKEWFSDLFDWIEIKLERQTQKIDRYTKRADNLSDAGKYGRASKNYRSAISAAATQTSYEKTAYGKYNAQADTTLDEAVLHGVVSRNVADGIKEKVKNGAMEISLYSEEIQEVIKDYQSWYDKAEKAKDAISDLHNDIRTYVSDLKELRDAQRDAKIKAIENYTSIGTAGIANGAGAKNAQLKHTNKQLLMQNKAYTAEMAQVSKTAVAIGKRGNRAISSAIKSNAAKSSERYEKALKRAKKSIKAKKSVAVSDLKIIREHSVSTYNNLYAYNLALKNIETVKLEQAANYASNSSEIYQNIAQKYENKDEGTTTRIDLLKKKSSNAKSVSEKNALLTTAAGKYDTIIANDNREIKEYQKKRKSGRKTINSKAGTTAKFKSLSSKTKKAVKKVINAAKSAAKSKKPISPSTLSSLAKYYSKGYVTQAFYEACVSYNDATESLELAKEQKELDIQEAIEEKASLGAEMVSNIEKEYENKLNENGTVTQQFKTAQSLKTTRGLSLSAGDYRNLIEQSRKDQALYSQSAADISKQIESNLANGYWTKDSQEYKDAINSMNDYSNKAEECRVEQEEWNNEIADIPYSNLEKMLDLLDAVKSNYESALSIGEAKGLSETASQYMQEIANANAEMAKYEELRTQAWSDYQKALANSDSVYGGKTADEWLQSYYEYDTSVNNLSEDIVELNNEIANLPYETVQKMIDLLESAQSLNESAVNLKTAMGIDLDESDYVKQMADNNALIEQYENERIQAYSDYLKALADPEGVYGGKTANEWLIEYNGFAETVNGLKKDNEELKDSLRDDVYWRTFERAHDAAQRFHNVLSGLSSLMDDSMYIDDDGKFTEYGVARIANLVNEYENARKEVSNYMADIGNLNKLYANGYYTENEYAEKLNELQTGLLDAASSMQDFTNSIVDMYKNMAQAELDSLMELIDARNDALSAKKAYYDYDKSIKEKTKDIQTLEAEIAALNGVETAEAKAKRASYEAQLAESKEELDDAVQEHIFDLSQDALDELKNTLQDAFDDKWEDINANLSELASLMATANQLTQDSAGTIVSTMNKLLEHYGISPASSGIQVAYAAGTKRVSRNVTALTNENGNEIIVTKDGMIAPLKFGDGVLPSYLTDRLYELALNGAPSPVMPVPKIDIPKIQPHTTEVNQHYDSLINIEGSADAATVEDLKSLSKNIMEKSYAYTSRKIFDGYMRSGGRRNV